MSAPISAEIKSKTHGTDPPSAGPLQKRHSQAAKSELKTENQAPHPSSAAQIAATALPSSRGEAAGGKEALIPSHTYF